MEYTTRNYPQFSACGLNCGLCSRYYTDGESRCPGCAGDGFLDVHPTCGILSCCQRKNIEYCFECEEFPCKKYNTWGDADSFITHKNYLTDMKKAKENGIEAYKVELNLKIKVLEDLLINYNDGRRKSFYCLAINLLDLEDIDSIMEQIKNEVSSKATLKDRANTAVRLFNSKADAKGISIKMRIQVK